ncbi:hypothetical protein ACQY0O_003987 [Thecaphora frezii]
MTSVDQPAPLPSSHAAADQPAQPPPRPPPRKRNRQALSCTACRERKIKCDRTVPCSQCIKRGDQLHCRIEQKPKIDHSKAAKAKTQKASQQPSDAHPSHPPQPQPSSSLSFPLAGQPNASSSSGVDDHRGQGPPSPGTMAYNQFSAALSTTGSSYASNSPPPAEVDAIKARLALLESVLGQMSPASMSNLTLAALNPGNSTSPSSSSHHASGPSWRPRGSSGSSPLDSFNGAPRSDSTRSTSLGAHSQSPASQQRTESDSEDEPDWMSLRSSDVHRASASVEASNLSASRLLHSSMANAEKISRKELDSDTEEAVMVLETLAMGNGQQSGGACPTTLAKQAAADARCQQDYEEVRVGFERCLLKDKQHDIMSEDCQEAKSAGSANATANSCEQLAAAPTLENRDANSGVTGSKDSLLPTAITPWRSNAPGAAAAPGVGGPQCACGPNCKEDQAGPHAGADAKPAVDACSGLRPKSELVRKACQASCNHQGLLRPKNGPETLLGWGIGWAFAAGDALLQEDFRRAKAEGRTLVVTEKTEREAVLRTIIEALPSKEIVNQLIEVYESRVRYLCGHIIHVPCLRREIEAFYALESVEKRARVVNHVDAGWLAMLLSTLALALRFYPCQPKPDWVSIQHLFDGGQTVNLWHSASKTCLSLAGYLNSTSISVLQSILLNTLLLSGIGGVTGPNEVDQVSTQSTMIRVAISNAQQMGLHRLGDLDKQGTPDDPPSKTIRREIAKRVWWALVMKDWTSAASGCRKDYAIERDRFNTPMPGNYNDEDLLTTPLPAPRPREEFTEMSYVLANLEFGLAIKEDFDVRNRREMLAASTGGDRRLTCAEARRLDQRYRSVLENAPSFFKVGSEIGRVTCIEVQRWLLQQGVFSKLLRIHRPTLSSRQESRMNCVLLARSILDMQKKIRSRCTVIDRLWINLMQSFSAAIVLALHLLHSRPQADHRLSVRSEITEAIDALKQIDGGSCTNTKCIRVIEALLAEEEERWQAGNAVLAESSGRAGPDAKKPSQSSHSGSNHAATVANNNKRKWHNEHAVQGEQEAAPGGGRRKNLLSLAQRVAAATMGTSADSPQIADVTPADNGSSKRAATQAAVQNFGAGDSFLAASLGPAASTNAELGAGTTALLGTMALPGLGTAPLAAFPGYGGVNGAVNGGLSQDSFDFQFPVLPYTGQLQQPFYNFSNSYSGNAAAANANANAARHVAAPNGIELSLNNPNTPPDGQAFDLAAFLEQCENSPGSSSEGGPSIDQRSVSFASDTSGHDQSRSASIDGYSFDASSQASADATRPGSSGAAVRDGRTAPSPNSAPVEAGNNMDSFWNWILNQGAEAVVASPSGAGGTTPGPSTATAPPNPFAQSTPSSLPGTAASAPAFSGLTPFATEGLSFPTAVSGGNPASVASMPVSAPAPASVDTSFATLNTVPNAPSASAALTTSTASTAASTTTTTSAAVGYPFIGVGTPSKMDSGDGGASDAPGKLHTIAPSPSPFGASLQSYGTPSAEVGLDNFLAGPPLYDFTDYALAWTASNPQMAPPPTSSQGPISDP